MNIILTGVLSLIVGIVLWVIKRERILLIYDISESEIFPRENTSGKYFVCRLRNAGNRAIENISYKFGLNEGKIESVKYSDSKLIQVSNQGVNEIQGTIPLLNPKEELSAIVTIADARNYSTATIEARAVGVTAKRKESDSMPGYLQPIIFTTMIIAAGCIGYSTTTLFYHIDANRALEKLDEVTKGVTQSEKNIQGIQIKTDELLEKLKRENEAIDLGKPEREQIIFTILNETGLGNILPSLLMTGDELPYWKTGLCLVYFYLSDKKNAHKYLDAFSRLSRIDGISPSSKGFILYLAGKIEQDQGNGIKAMEYFDTCKKETPLMYEQLIHQDTSFDLRAVEKSLKTFMLNKLIMPYN